MNEKEFYHKLKIFLNEPCLLKHYLQRGHSFTSSKTQSLKSIFPPIAQLERFRHLQDARLSRQRDSTLDSHLLNIVKSFEGQVALNQKKDKELEFKRENCLGKLKMDYVQQQMAQNLEELTKLIKQHQQYNNLIGQEKKFVEKMILTTEIKKALMIQNNILKKENELLKKQENQIDLQLGESKK